jgi:hypothetical protein
MPMSAIDWGPVSAWAAAVATFGAALIAILVALGVFDSFRAPRIRITFEDREPWARSGSLGNAAAYWVRVGVENVGRRAARGCVGRLTGIATDDAPRRDVDPVQLRWAGMPRSRSFEPIDLRPGQREFLNVLVREGGERWRIVTFEDPDFDPGFATELVVSQVHVLRVAVFADNAETVVSTLQVDGRRSENRPELSLVAQP